MMEAKVTIPALAQMKREGRKSVGVVAWDYQIARIADRAGVDFVSVGDSVGVNLWGHSNPLEVTMEEIERRVAAKNQFTIIGKYVSGNVVVVQTALQIGFIEGSGVDRVIVWCIYEVKADKIAVVTLVGQRTDPQTARFIEWLQSQPPGRYTMRDLLGQKQ